MKLCEQIMHRENPELFNLDLIVELLGLIAIKNEAKTLLEKDHDIELKHRNKFIYLLQEKI